MRPRAYYIFFVLAMLSALVLVASIITCFLIMPADVYSVENGIKVGATPRWVVALCLFGIGIVVESILFLHTLSFVKDVIPGSRIQLFRLKGLNVGIGNTSKVLRRVDGRWRLVTKNPLPDPRLRRMGLMGGTMSALAFIILLMTLMLSAISHHPENAANINNTFGFCCLTLVLLLLIGSFLVEKKVKNDNL
jgi:hypothetical protein